MSAAEKELEEQLIEAGNKLLQPPSSLDELLPLLDQVENFLARVEQSPAKSMQNALSPLMRALVADELLRHSDEDVKVAVASCISEITRITAPDAPYDDDKMKDVFQLIVSSFEDLSDKSSRTYSKRAMILETVAKVRSCVVMLDLECDSLLVEMFQHFTKAIRDYHSESIFSSMETIMTLVLEESEDISLDLLKPLFDSVRKDNEEVSPIAKRLGERVFENCAVKLRPYAPLAVKSLGLCLDDFSKVVKSICEGTYATVENSNENTVFKEQLAAESKLTSASQDQAPATQADGSKTATASSNEEAQEAEAGKRENHSDDIGGAVDISPKSIMANGINETGNEGPSVDVESAKKAGHHDSAAQPNVAEVTSKHDTDDSESGIAAVKLESKLEQTARKRGRKSKAGIVDSSELAHASSDKETEKLPDCRKGRDKDISFGDATAIEAANSLDKEKGAAPESETANTTSTSPSGGIPDESRIKKIGRPRKKDSIIEEEKPLSDVTSKKASERTNDSESKSTRHPGKKAPFETVGEETVFIEADTPKNEGGSTSDSEQKRLKHPSKKVDESNNNDDATLSVRKEDGRKRSRGKPSLEKVIVKSSVKDDTKEMVSPPISPAKSGKDEANQQQTPRTSSKRKRTPGKDKVTDIVDHGENLVGSKVKVWWPKDRAFYEGVIESFDQVKKKHKVLYNDGDEEILNLKKERWELIRDDSATEEQGAEDTSPDASLEMQKRKKAKANAETSAKHGKTEVSPRSDEAASSGRMKGTTTKSGRKSMDDTKVDFKSKDSLRSSRGEDDNSRKSKVLSQKGGCKAVDESEKSSGKSKDIDASASKSKSKSKQDSSKSASKSKQDVSKAASKSKGNTPQSSSKTNVNGTGTSKLKSGFSKAKESGEGKEKSTHSAKVADNVKRKSPDTGKERESETKNSKKRGKSVKG